MQHLYTENSKHPEHPDLKPLMEKRDSVGLHCGLHQEASPNATGKASPEDSQTACSTPSTPCVSLTPRPLCGLLPVCAPESRIWWKVRKHTQDAGQGEITTWAIAPPSWKQERGYHWSARCIVRLRENILRLRTLPQEEVKHEAGVFIQGWEGFRLSSRTDGRYFSPEGS